MVSRLFIACISVSIAVASAAVPRRVRIDGQRFVVAATNATIVMAGPNVVVKGHPYLPSTTGNTICNDEVNSTCSPSGTCISCETFNLADVMHLKKMGWDTIRLGVVWAGAQPTDDNTLDLDFVTRLHNLLDLTDKNNINVILDNHGDMVGTAGCGNGVPMWFQKKAAPELIGKPLTTGFPYSLVSSLEISKVGGYSHCGDNSTLWAQHAGDPNYNLLNECCQQMNGPNPGALGYTTISQKTMDYVVKPGAGRDDFVRFWTLLAEVVKGHPSAFAAELMNEPMSIKRGDMFDTWRACAEAINSVIPDMSVALADTGEGAIVPSWLTKLLPAPDISHDTKEWIKQSNTLFYAWHYYGDPKTAAGAVKNVLAIGSKWNVPTFATEFMSCDAWKAAKAANISHSYWHYSSYCTTGPDFGNRQVPTDTFGACILGWAGGDSSYTCN